MNKHLPLLLTAFLSLASAQDTSSETTEVTGVDSQSVSTSAPDPQLKDSPVSVETGSYTGPLSSLLAAIAKTAGYGLVLDTNIDSQAAAGTSTRPVVYSFKDKPFNQVWPLLMDVYGLSYQIVEIGGEPLLRVSNTPIQRVITLKNAKAVQAANQVKMFFGTPTYSEQPVKNDKGEVTGTTTQLTDIKLDSPTLRVIPDARSNSVIVRGTNREVLQVEQLLANLDATENPEPEVEPEATEPPAPPAPSIVQEVYESKGNPEDLGKVLVAQYPTFKVTVVGKTNQLVITGPEDLVKQAVALLNRVDRPLPEPEKPAEPEKPVTVDKEQIVQEVFTLINASAEEVKATLEGTLSRKLQEAETIEIVEPAAGTTGTKAAPTAPVASGNQANSINNLTIIADKRTNLLIVRGTPDQVKQIAELVPALDKVVPQINVQVRIQEVTELATQTLGMDWKVSFGGFNVNILKKSGLKATFNPTQNFQGFNIFPTLAALETQQLTRSIYDGSITMQSGQRALGSNAGTQNASGDAAASVKSGGRLELNVPVANGENITKQIDYGVNLDFFNPQVAPDGTITLRIKGQINDLRTAIDAATIPNLLKFTNSEAQSTVTFKSGQTVLLSGLLSTKEKENSDGIPVLSKIPFIGGLFGNQKTEKTETQLLVILTGTVVK